MDYIVLESVLFQSMPEDRKMDDKKTAVTKAVVGVNEALAELRSVQDGELQIGAAFHAFRFKEGQSVQESLKELQSLQAGELSVGTTFHAFRFNSESVRDLTEIEKKELNVGNAFHAFRFS